MEVGVQMAAVAYRRGQARMAPCNGCTTSSIVYNVVSDMRMNAGPDFGRTLLCMAFLTYCIIECRVDVIATVTVLFQQVH